MSLRTIGRAELQDIKSLFDRLCLCCGIVREGIRAAQEREEKEMIMMINGERTERAVLPERLKEYIGDRVQIHGSIYKIRKMKGFAFVLLRTARRIVQCVYSEEKAEFSLEELQEESCVCLTAEVAAEERSRTGYELLLIRVQVLSSPEEASPIVIHNKLVDTSLENLLDYRPVTLRNEKERAIFKLQEGITLGIRRFLRKNRFTEIHTPKIVYSGAEGARIFSTSITSAERRIWHRVRSFISR